MVHKYWGQNKLNGSVVNGENPFLISLIFAIKVSVTCTQYYGRSGGEEEEEKKKKRNEVSVCVCVFI